MFPKHQTAQLNIKGLLFRPVQWDSESILSQAERVLWGQQLKLDRKKLYNLARLSTMPSTQDGLLSLIAVLNRKLDVPFVLEYVRDPVGTVTSRILKAVFFTNDELIKRRRRFAHTG